MKFLLIVLSLISITVYASDTATGKVNIIGGQYVSTSSIYFGLDVAPANRPACSTNPDYFYVIDINTEEGKALYSALLMAKASNSTVSVKGSGTCALNQPMESVVYWVLRP